MATVERSIRLAADADAVWARIGGFDALPTWHPAVLDLSEVEEEGHRYRDLMVVGNIRLRERLIEHDETGRFYRYTIVDGPLPVEGYVSRLAVADNGDGTATVTWSAEFSPAGATEEVATGAVEGIYDSGMQSLESAFGRAG